MKGKHTGKRDQAHDAMMVGKHMPTPKGKGTSDTYDKPKGKKGK